jgi:hypothetical protein
MTRKKNVSMQRFRDEKFPVVEDQTAFSGEVRISMNKRLLTLSIFMKCRLEMFKKIWVVKGECSDCTGMKSGGKVSRQKLWRGKKLLGMWRGKNKLMLTQKNIIPLFWDEVGVMRRAISHILNTRSPNQLEIKFGKKHCPMRLTVVEDLRGHKIKKVMMIINYWYGPRQAH